MGKTALTFQEREKIRLTEYRPANNLDIDISIEDSSLIYTDIYALIERSTGPPDLRNYLSRVDRGEKPFMVPVRIIGPKTIEFAEDIKGHTANGLVPSNRGWHLNIEWILPTLYVKTNGNNSDVSIKTGPLKGKKGRVIKRFSKLSVVLFGEDVGGFSFDGLYGKGTCLIIEDKHLKKHRKSTKAKS